MPAASPPYLDIEREISNIRNRPDGVWLTTALERIRDSVNQAQKQLRSLSTASPAAAVAAASSTPTAPASTTVLLEAAASSGSSGVSGIIAGINAQTGTSYTLQTSDGWQLVTFQNAGAVGVSLPTSLGNFYCSVWNLGSGTVTLTPTSGTINGSATLALAASSGALLFSNGSLWGAVVALPAGSGSGTLPYPDNPPSSPSSWDDEFNSATLDAKWTLGGPDPEGVTGSGTSHDVDTTWPSWLQARIASASTPSFIARQAFAPGAAFSLTVKMAATPAVNYNGVYLYVTDAAMSNAVRGAWEYASPITVQQSNATFSKKVALNWSFGVFSVTDIRSRTYYFHLQWDGLGNWRYWASVNGISWNELTSGNYGVSFTPAYLFLCFKLNGGTGDYHSGVDWIRANWLTLP